MKVAFVSAELAPYVQVGGLADVARWLPSALADLGDDVRVFVPNYDVLDPGTTPLLARTDLGTLDLGALGSMTVSTLGTGSGGAPIVYLVGSPRWFERECVYGSAGDDHLRFACLSAAVPAICTALEWVPDVVHANDWHSALLPLHMETLPDPWPAIPVVLTIHNLAYQGIFPGSDLAAMGLHPIGTEVNSLRVGITRSAMVTTVSPTFANEIVQPERGMGLGDELRSLGDRLVGILNGVGDEWDPARDAWIPHPYSEPAGKAPNAVALRTRMGLASVEGVPLLAIVSRLDPQKGFELLETTVPPLLEDGRAQLVVLGRGDPRIEAMFTSMAARFPESARFERVFDRGLGHLIEAGADIFLMPSRFEPSGLNQMYSMKYGTVPVVHRTGGLADTVIPWDGANGTGFTFDEFTPEGFASALGAALALFEDRDSWTALQRSGMAQDFSWGSRAVQYRDVYRRALRY